MFNYKEWTVLHIMLFVTFVVSGLIINLIQGVFYLVLASTNRQLFRKINYYLIWMIYAQVKTKKLFIQTKEPNCVLFLRCYSSLTGGAAARSGFIWRVQISLTSWARGMP